MNVALPWVLGVAAIAALITCALHFLSVRRPPTMVLPTMRFLPDRPVRAVSRSARPSDLLLLLLRVAVLMLAGVALAGVTWRGAQTTRGRVVVVDVGNTAQPEALRARVSEVLRARAALSSGDSNTKRSSLPVSPVATRMVLVDSVARVLSVSALRSLRPDTLASATSSTTLSAALLAAMRAATSLVRDEINVDSVELDVISTFTAAGNDASLRAVRLAWPGRIRLSQLPTDASGADSVVNAPVRLVGATPNTALLAAFGTRVSASASIAIEWPTSGMPAGWTASGPDTIGALIAAAHAIVFPFVRTAHVPDSLLKTSRAVAWWSDGAVAAIESRPGNPCQRQIGAVVPASSDVFLGASARPLLSLLSAPCGVRSDASPLADVMRQFLAGTESFAPAASFRSAAETRTPWGSVMLAVAILLLAVEWWVRDRQAAADERVDMSKRALQNVA